MSVNVTKTWAMEKANVVDALVSRRTIKRRHSTFSRRPASTKIITVVVAILAKLSKAQIGITDCICSPSSYNMTLNFTQTCEDNSVQGNGILTTDCAIAPFQNENVTDLVPVSVGSIDLLELDVSLELLSQSSKFGTYVDGDSFSYNSLSSDLSMINATAFPKALQISVIGNNAEGEALFFAALIIYETDCGAAMYPAILENSRIGWITFVELQDPLVEVCPQAGMSNSTQTPTSVPLQITPTPPTTISTKSPSLVRSTKAPSPVRSTKAPSPTGPTAPSAPTPTKPTTAPGRPETQKPTCNYHRGSRSSHSKEKGKTKKSKGSKKSKSKSTKSSKGKGSEYSHHFDYDYDYYYKYDSNIFDHEECGSSKAVENNEHRTPTPTKAPVQAPVAPGAGGSGDWSWDDGSAPSVVVEESNPAPANGNVSTATTQDSHDYATQSQDGDLEERESINEQSEQHESSSKSGVDAAFGSSAAMYGVLTGGVVVAIVAILVWKRPDPAFMCSKCTSASSAEKENMVIALVKGMNS